MKKKSALYYSQVPYQQTNTYMTLQKCFIHPTTSIASPWNSLQQNSEVWFIPLLWREKGDKGNLRTANRTYKHHWLHAWSLLSVMQGVEQHWFPSNPTRKCRICRVSFTCFDFIETKVQHLQPECHLSHDHTITELVFLCGFNRRIANSCYLAKGHKTTFLSVTHPPAQ